MITAKKIKEYRNSNRLAPLVEGQQDLNLFLIEALIGITEHLEAQPEPGVLLVRSDDTIRRDAMIEALRWECGKCGGCTSYEENKDCRVPQAIARLENGGDL